MIVNSSDTDSKWKTPQPKSSKQAKPLVKTAAVDNSLINTSPTQKEPKEDVSVKVSSQALISWEKLKV